MVNTDILYIYIHTGDKKHVVKESGFGILSNKNILNAGQIEISPGSLQHKLTLDFLLDRKFSSALQKYHQTFLDRENSFCF